MPNNPIKSVPAKRRKSVRETPKPKAIHRAKLAPLAVADVHLVRTKGTKNRGGGRGGEAWRIETGGKRAGIVFINLIDEKPIGKHASIQIYLNVPSQGRHIGRYAYRKACEASAYDTVYAHMRKSNVASRRAAEEAGFVDVTPSNVAQLILVRHRPK